MLNDFSHEAIATNTIRGMINRGGVQAIRQWQGIRDRVPVNAIDADNAAARTTSRRSAAAARGAGSSRGRDARRSVRRGRTGQDGSGHATQERGSVR